MKILKETSMQTPGRAIVEVLNNQVLMARCLFRGLEELEEERVSGLENEQVSCSSDVGSENEDSWLIDATDTRWHLAIDIDCL